MCCCCKQVNTVWTVGQSPIVISSGIAVASSATLTVNAGVHVVFTDVNAIIEVFGTLTHTFCLNVMS